MRTSILALLALVSITLLGACCGGNEEENFGMEEGDYLIFGHFYGFCYGADCIQIYQLDHELLREDTTDVYPQTVSTNYPGDFSVILSNDLREETLVLWEDFPEALLAETETTFGCPDCYDQGGYYLEYKNGNTSDFWIFDTNLADVPAYMQEYLELIKEKIELINE